MFFCRSLGFTSGEFASGIPLCPGEPDVPIVLDNAVCDGSENNLQECPGTWGTHNCGHTEDVWLKCN